MQNILLAIDGLKTNTSSLDFACYLARVTKSKLTGVFLENMIAEQRPVLKEAGIAPELVWEADKVEHDIKSKTIERHISFFKEACIKREVTCSIHRDRNIPAKEMIEESRFADLLVVDAETSFNKRYEGVPTEFVKDVLKNAECPVIIAPGSCESIEEIVFMYDGSKSAVFAMKQFGYLFPEWRNKKATLLEINPGGEMKIEQNHKIREWLKAHYSNCDYKILRGDVNDQALGYLLNRKNSFAVLGSFGRNMLSEIFRKSTAERIIKATDLPLFITHP